MLGRLRRRFRRARLGSRAALVLGDIRALPFRKRVRFKAVLAPYGMLQSLLCDRDLAATLRSVSGVVARGGVFAVDLVPDLPRWQECHRRVSLRGRRPGGGQLTLIESVRQDPDRRFTIFDQEFVERRDGRRETRRFSLAFRTLTVPQISRRLERAGFTVDAVLGDYRGRAWSPEADVWLILAPPALVVCPRKTLTPGGASRLPALLPGRILPVCSLVAPCQPGAARRQVCQVISGTHH